MKGVLVTGGAANSTLNIFDSIDGGGGNNKVELTMTGTGALSTASAPVLKNIQTLDVRAASTGGADTVNLAGGLAPALTTLNVDSIGNAFVGQNLNKAVSTLGISNVTTDSADATYTYLAGLTGTSDALKLNLNGVQNASGGAGAGGTWVDVAVNGAAAGDGWDVVNVTATGANRLNTLTVQDSAATTTLRTLNVDGTGSFRVNTAIDFFGTSGTVDASKNSGGVNLSFVADDVKATGGSGNDVFSFAAGTLNTSDVIDGGAGKDTLSVADTTIDAATTALNNAIKAAKNIEVIRMNGATATLAANVLEQTEYQLAVTAGGAVTVTDINGDAIALQTAAGAVSLGNAVGATNLSLTVTNSGTAAGGSTLNTTGFNVVDLVSNSSNGTANVFTGAVTNNANMTVNITGTAGLTANSGFSGQVVINGAEAGGVLSLTGSGAADSITGSAFADILNGDAGNDIIKGGAGNDQITGGAGADTIDGGEGIDTYTIAAGTAATDSALTGVSGAITAANLATFTKVWDTYTVTSGDTLFIDSADIDVTGALVNNGTSAVLVGGAVAAGGAITWNDGEKTYLVVDTSATGGAGLITADDTFLVIDGVVTLTGVAAAGNDANFIVA